MGTTPLRSGINMLELLRRKEISYTKLSDAFGLETLPEQVAEQVEVHAKYEGYIVKQRQEVERALKLENKRIPDDVDYHAIKELSAEAAEKLDKVRPTSIGQASRISGVSPADVNVLMIALELKKAKGAGLMTFAEILQSKGAEAGLSFTEVQLQQFTRYYEMLVETNKVMNLTAITEPEEVAVKHMIDSLLAYDKSFAGKTLADVGTGAGFPGVPLKIFAQA